MRLAADTGFSDKLVTNVPFIGRIEKGVETSVYVEEEFAITIYTFFFSFFCSHLFQRHPLWIVLGPEGNDGG